MFYSTALEVQTIDLNTDNSTDFIVLDTKKIPGLMSAGDMSITIPRELLEIFTDTHKKIRVVSAAYTNVANAFKNDRFVKVYFKLYYKCSNIKYINSFCIMHTLFNHSLKI